MKNENESSHSTTSVGKKPQDLVLEQMLVKGEEVIIKADLHPAIYWKSVGVLLLSVFMLILGIMPFFLLLMIVGGLMLIASILTQHYLLLAVTNKRILARYGLLQMDVVDIRLSKIESIDLERMLTGHIFGYANVVVMGTGQRVIRIPYIRNAEAFRKFYNQMVLAEEGNAEAEQEIKNVKAQEAELEEKAKRTPTPRKKKV